MKLNDYPMKCCGMVEASDITTGVPATFERKFSDERYGDWTEYETSDEDWENHFKRIEEHQRKHRRNCALMTLAVNYQKTAIAQVERLGWKCILEFYNPNSSGKVRVYSKVLWDGETSYNEDLKAGKVTPKGTTLREMSIWTRPHNEGEKKEEENAL